MSQSVKPSLTFHLSKKLDNYASSTLNNKAKAVKEDLNEKALIFKSDRLKKFIPRKKQTVAQYLILSTRGQTSLQKTST